jgi:hypothetical protein
MRVRFAVVILALSLVGAAGDESLPDHCAILSVSEGPALIKQCSRSSPTDVSGFWSPSPSQMNAIEQLLPELLRKSGHKLNLSHSNRQYVGITSHGKKLIYVNSFPGSILTESNEQRDWRTKAIIICDGGEAFWGVEFDPADNTFHNIQFNGIG